MGRIAAVLWTPTKASPEARTRFNLRFYRGMLVITPVVVPLAYWMPRVGIALLMLVSMATQVTTNLDVVQTGDVRESVS